MHAPCSSAWLPSFPVDFPGDSPCTAWMPSVATDYPQPREMGVGASVATGDPHDRSKRFVRR
jgi:hypothetical protein